MIDSKWINHSLPVITFPIERSRLRCFAEAIGETNPIYLCEGTARAAGHPDLPAPPTFLFSAEMDSDHKLRGLMEIGVTVANILHGEQSFSYHRMAYAGDTVTVRSRITDINQRKNGRLEVIVMDTSVVNQREELVAESRSAILVRN